VRRSLAALALVTFAAGCGGDPGGGMGITGGTQSSTVEPTRDKSGVTSTALRTCLETNGVKLFSKGETYTDPSGTVNSYGNVDVNGSEYVGEAIWPPNHHAGVYLAPSDSAADDAERQLEQFIEAFGEDPADFVQRQGNVLVLLDDNDQPTPPEAKILNDCAMPD
jgi:hypothetical protein